MANEVDLYLRLSIARDGSDSIERQEADLRAWAEREGLTVRKVWGDPGKSGYKNVARAEYQKAVAAVTSGEVSTLATWKLDRLSRKGAGQVGTLLDDVDRVGGRLVFLKDSLDSSVPGHRLVIVLVSEQARTESANTALRVLSKNQYNVAQGLPVPGKRRVGFLSGNVKAHPEEAPLVAKAYADLLAGRSIRSIAIEWGKAPVRVREILVNPAYAGYVVRQGVRYEAAPEVDRIVSREDWEAAQALLSDEARKTTTGPTRKHLLSGIARCGVCGEKMRSTSVYYVCAASTAHAQIEKRQLDPYVKARLAIELTEDDGMEPVEAVAVHARRLEELEAERSRWTAVAALPGADMAQVGRELARIAREAESASEALGQARVANHQALLVEDVMAAVEVMNAVGVDDDGVLDLDLGEFVHYFDELDLDARRGLIESKLTVKVNKGRGLNRVEVLPRTLR